MNQHTPGPWLCEAVGISVACGQKKIVATFEIELEIEGASVFDMQANARLIAAAPELLAALEKIAEYPGESLPFVQQLARAAVTKAEGKE
jgi:hypothetical protein